MAILLRDATLRMPRSYLFVLNKAQYLMPWGEGFVIFERLLLLAQAKIKHLIIVLRAEPAGR